MAYHFATLPDLKTLGPRIVVTITPSSALIRALTGSDELGDYASRKTPATMVIDTGAQTTMIDKAITKALGLRRHGTTTIISPGGERQCLTYDMDMTFDAHNHTLRNVRVVEGDFREKQGMDGIIGRDILENALFIYQGKNEQYTIAF
ncbi:MAG: aspartyl protease family protein [Patescibacteria group bacterium]